MENFWGQFIGTALITFFVTFAIVFYIKMREKEKQPGYQRNKDFDITIGE